MPYFDPNFQEFLWRHNIKQSMCPLPIVPGSNFNPNKIIFSTRVSICCWYTSSISPILLLNPMNFICSIFSFRFFWWNHCPSFCISVLICAMPYARSCPRWRIIIVIEIRAVREWNPEIRHNRFFSLNLFLPLYWRLLIYSALCRLRKPVIIENVLEIPLFSISQTNQYDLLYRKPERSVQKSQYFLARIIDLLICNRLDFYLIFYFFSLKEILILREIFQP